MRLLTEAGLCAAVPDAPASVRARRRDLMAHQAVLGESAAQGPVLPVRFAVLTPEAEALRTRLRYDHAHLTAQLDGVRDCVEMNGPVRARPPYPAAPRLRGERPAGRGAGQGRRPRGPGRCPPDTGPAGRARRAHGSGTGSTTSRY
ncbi:GvpL/GvpF family gas vesicle protein [Streptomyces sp. NPDC058947]|uniref:GvpL/GvpF family gas vesicle protein n=1 Tax=Streptomyces sp. NPDC058947 TaxID=3346675 RepID=UPI00369B0354